MEENSKKEQQIDSVDQAREVEEAWMLHDRVSQCYTHGKMHPTKHRKTQGDQVVNSPGFHSSIG